MFNDRLNEKLNLHYVQLSYIRDNLRERIDQTTNSHYNTQTLKHIWTSLDDTLKKLKTTIKETLELE